MAKNQPAATPPAQESAPDEAAAAEAAAAEAAEAQRIADEAAAAQREIDEAAAAEAQRIADEAAAAQAQSAAVELEDLPAVDPGWTNYVYPTEAMDRYNAGDPDAAHKDEFGFWREGPKPSR